MAYDSPMASATDIRTPLTPEDWDAAIGHTKGPQLVVSGPGAGKTEFLVRRAAHLSKQGVTPHELVVLSFSRRNAADLERRITAVLPDEAQAIRATTFHSLGFRILEALGGSVFGWQSMPALLTGPEQVAFVSRLLRSELSAAWPEHLRRLLHNRSFAEEVTDFLLRASEHRMNADSVTELVPEQPDWAALPSFMTRYRQALKDEHRIDYASLLGLAIDTLQHPAAAEFLSDVSHVLVDEYQDTTPTQVAFLDALTKSTGNLTVAADPYQSIFSFRGADLANVANFPEAFPGTTTFVLTQSFRVPKEVLRSAEQLTLGELPGSAGPVSPAGAGGRVDVFGFDQHTHEAEWIAGELHRIHLMDKVPFSRMAVLLRTKQRVLPELSRALERRGIPHNRPNQRLTDQPAIRFLRDLTALAAGGLSPSETLRAARRILLGPFFQLAIGKERAISRLIEAQPDLLPELIADQVAEGVALSQLLSSTDWATSMPARDGFWYLWTTLPQFSMLVELEDGSQFIPPLSSLSQVLSHLAEREPGMTLHDYFQASDQGEFEADTLLSFTADEDDALVLTTLHQSKGLEFDTVFIADAIDGAFPDLRRRTSLLNTHYLSPALRSPLAERQFRLQEETRLAYTAMTRASRRVIWTYTTAATMGVIGRPSRFIDQLGGPQKLSEAHDDPVTASEAEGLLRRTLTDPRCLDVKRLAALSVLSRNPGGVLSDPSSFTGLVPKDPEAPIVDPQAHFSPSQADLYSGCPLRYAFYRHVGLGGSDSVYMSFGTLIHGIAEKVDLLLLKGDLPTDKLSVSLELLDESFDPVDFGGDPWAQVWHENGIKTLTKLYTSAPLDGYTVRFAEKHLNLEIEGERWVGRADRIDQNDDGHLRVVDYKTGTGVPSQAEVAESTQLGFYQMAALADADVQQMGEVTEAELWFPRGPNKGFTRRRFDPANVPLVRERLIEIAIGVRSESFEPTINPSCGRCDFRILCPAQPDGQEAFTA